MPLQDGEKIGWLTIYNTRAVLFGRNQADVIAINRVSRIYDHCVWAEFHSNKVFFLIKPSVRAREGLARLLGRVPE